MQNKNLILRIDTRRITDWPTFHALFAELLGFPSFYGRNMNAWIDCMTSLDQDDGMTALKVPPGRLLVLHLEYVDDFATRCPDLFAALTDATAFVNFRRIQLRQELILALSFHKSPPLPSAAAPSA